MCGRFTLGQSNKEIESHLEQAFQISASSIETIYPRYNIAPGQKIVSIIHDGHGFRAGELEWGFTTMQADMKPLINARAETLLQKPTFKQSFASKRCIILCDGYYEWQTLDSGKQPYYIQPGSTFGYMAGIYTSAVGSDGQKKHTAAIITTAANPLLSSIHHRMPLFIPESMVGIWLTKEPSLANQQQSFTLTPVSTLVNSIRNDSINCITPM